MAKTRRLFWLLVTVLVAAVFLAGGHAAPALSCPAKGQETAEIARVEPRLELRLTDGRAIRMAGVDPAAATPNAPELPDTSQARLRSMLAGKAVTLAVLSSAPDRWGRIPALVFPSDGGSRPGGLGAEAIAAGLGRYLAEPAAHACRDELIAAELEARSTKLGLWSDPYYAVLAVDDHAGFAERSATVVLAEGQLTAVEPSPYRTVLRFADPGPRGDGGRAHGGRMLVATIPPRVMKSFEARKVNVRAMIGQRLRFRGLLDLRFGPRIELAGPDALELGLSPADAH